MADPQLFGQCILPGCVNPVVPGETLCSGCRDIGGQYLLPVPAQRGPAPDVNAWIGEYERRRTALRPNPTRRRKTIGTCSRCGRIEEIIASLPATATSERLPGIVDHHRIDGRTCPGSGLPPRGEL